MSNDQPIYLSSDSLVAFKKEYDELRDVKIPGIAKRIDEAKQQGDLSENAEYHQAREDMSWAQGRLQELEHITANAQLIAATQGNDTVQLGSTVTVKVNGAQKSYTIVGPQEAKPQNGQISNESPLGEAFLKKRVGDKIEVKIPAGVQTYQITAIK
jgi:transcription elongation factor GreA